MAIDFVTTLVVISGITLLALSLWREIIFLTMVATLSVFVFGIVQVLDTIDTL